MCVLVYVCMCVCACMCVCVCVCVCVCFTVCVDIGVAYYTYLKPKACSPLDTSAINYVCYDFNPLPTRWLRDLFEDADQNGDGTLDLKEVIAMLRRLNVGVSKKVIKQKFKVHICLL